jgi:hypothetical protein
MFTAIRAETAHSPTYLPTSEGRAQKEGRAVTGIWESSYCRCCCFAFRGAVAGGYLEPRASNFYL